MASASTPHALLESEASQHTRLLGVQQVHCWPVVDNFPPQGMFVKARVDSRPLHCALGLPAHGVRLHLSVRCCTCNKGCSHACQYAWVSGQMVSGHRVVRSNIVVAFGCFGELISSGLEAVSTVQTVSPSIYTSSHVCQLLGWHLMHAACTILAVQMHACVQRCQPAHLPGTCVLHWLLKAGMPRCHCYMSPACPTYTEAVMCRLHDSYVHTHPHLTSAICAVSVWHAWLCSLQCCRLLWWVPLLCACARSAGCWP
jgi:hypothetical protein